jgi:hypothetical protein
MRLRASSTFAIGAQGHDAASATGGKGRSGGTPSPGSADQSERTRRRQLSLARWQRLWRAASATRGQFLKPLTHLPADPKSTPSVRHGRNEPEQVGPRRQGFGLAAGRRRPPRPGPQCPRRSAHRRGVRQPLPSLWPLGRRGAHQVGPSRVELILISGGLWWWASSAKRPTPPILARSGPSLPAGCAH